MSLRAERPSRQNSRRSSSLRYIHDHEQCFVGIAALKFVCQRHMSSASPIQSGCARAITRVVPSICSSLDYLVEVTLLLQAPARQLLHPAVWPVINCSAKRRVSLRVIRELQGLSRSFGWGLCHRHANCKSQKIANPKKLLNGLCKSSLSKHVCRQPSDRVYEAARTHVCQSTS